MIFNKSYYGTYEQLSFSDVFESDDNFLDMWKDSAFYEQDLLSDAVIKKICVLLYGRYGNEVVASSDTNRFISRVFSIIWQYGPSWNKRVEIQKKLRALTDAEIATGTQAVYNEALNPQMTPGTDTLASLEYINSQRTTNYKKSKMDGYTQLLQLIDTDVTEEFLSKFKPLFLKVVSPQRPLLYESEE